MSAVDLDSTRPKIDPSRTTILFPNPRPIARGRGVPSRRAMRQVTPHTSPHPVGSALDGASTVGWPFSAEPTIEFAAPAISQAARARKTT